LSDPTSTPHINPSLRALLHQHRCGNRDRLLLALATLPQDVQADLLRLLHEIQTEAERDGARKFARKF
jgi:hypothetical protein